MTTIELQSSDGEIFPADLGAAKLSLTIRTMLLGIQSGKDGTKNENKDPLKLSNIKGNVLKKVMEWCEQHKNDEIKDEDNERSGTCQDVDNSKSYSISSLKFYKCPSILIFRLCHIPFYYNLHSCKFNESDSCCIDIS